MIYEQMVHRQVSSILSFPFLSACPTSSATCSSLLLAGCRIIQADDLETWIFGLKVLGDETETVYSGGESIEV